MFEKLENGEYEARKFRRLYRGELCLVGYITPVIRVLKSVHPGYEM